MRLLVALEALEARRLATEAVLRRLGPQPEIGPAAMAAKFDRRFRRLPHTNVMNDALAQLLVEPGGSLMIWTPPRAGKSELASRWFPDWWLTHWPTHRIVLTAYGERLPTRHSVAARDIMFAHGHEYGLAVSKAQAEKTSWSLTTGGGVIARGVGSGLTGEDMDVGVIDDPVKDREAAESELIRAKVWDWYSGAFLSRRVPHTRTCVIMTRWRTDDLAGRILDSEGRVEEGGRWRVVHLPALALPPDPEKGIYPDALGRAVGEPLPHPKLAADDWEGMAAHWATQRERSTARDWNALYQGVPFDAEGALLSEQDIRDHTGDAPREFRRLAVGVDPAGGGRDSVGVVVAGLDGEGRVWWLEDRTRRMSAVEWPRLVCEVADRWGADRVAVETNYGGDLGTAAVSQAWGELVREGQVSGLCPLVVSVTARKSKVLRAEPIAQAIRTGRVWFARGAVLRQLTAEWQMWTPGSKWSPGALDAAVHVATELLPALPRGAQITAVDGVSRQQVAADGLAGMRR